MKSDPMGRFFQIRFCKLFSIQDFFLWRGRNQCPKGFVYLIRRSENFSNIWFDEDNERVVF